MKWWRLWGSIKNAKHGCYEPVVTLDGRSKESPGIDTTCSTIGLAVAVDGVVVAVTLFCSNDMEKEG